MWVCGCDERVDGGPRRPGVNDQKYERERGTAAERHSRNDIPCLM